MASPTAGTTRASIARGRQVAMMLLVVLLLVLWFLGMVTTHTLGGLLHILLVIAIIFLLIGVIRGQTV
jgi:hypothetical protein